MITMFGYTFGKIKLDKWGYKVNEHGTVDYAVLSDDNVIIWYDRDFGIQFQIKESLNQKITSFSFDKNNNYIYYNIDKLENDDTIVRHKKFIIPYKSYTEESFFMESTLNDFGNFTFQDYKNFELLKADVLNVINSMQNIEI